MLNQGLRTEAATFVRWLGEPQPSDADIVDAMRLPPDVSIEKLAADEVEAIDGYHRAWTANSGLDTRELLLRNSACKRVLYLSAPIFLPDTIPVDAFVPTGVNSRIHIYPAPDVRDTVRLEAVSSYRVGGFVLRYALSIQYARDAVDLGWQIIRPVIVIDPELLAAAERAGAGAVDSLHRLFDTLWHIVLVGSHDYVHATVLNWFPPLRNLPAEYAAITCERVHPPEVDQWHEGSQTSLPQGLVPGRHTPQIATLELYSLLVHRQVIDRMWDRDPRVGARIHELLARFETGLADFLGHDPFGDPVRTLDAAEYLTTLAGWFLVSALPLGTDRLAEVLAVVPAERAERVRERLAAVHEGMFDFVRFADVERFPWRGDLVPLHRVGAEYEAALRWPALREHLRYLLLPLRRPHGDARTWAQVLCAPLPDTDRADVLAALGELRDSTDRSECARGMARLAESGNLDLLRAVSRPDDAVDQASGEPAGATRYARAVLASLVTVIDALRTEHAPLPVGPLADAAAG